MRSPGLKGEGLCWGGVCCADPARATKAERVRAPPRRARGVRRAGTSGRETGQAAGGQRGQAGFLEIEHAVLPTFLHQGAQAFVEVVGQLLLHGDVLGPVDLGLAVREERCRVVLDGGADQSLDAFRDFGVRGAVVVLREIHGCKAGHRRPPRQRLKDLLLVVKVVVDIGLGHAQRAHDLLHRGVGVALLVEQHFGGLEDALALFIGAGRRCLLAPARLDR